MVKTKLNSNQTKNWDTTIHTDLANEINTVAEKVSPIWDDILLIEDSESGNEKKKVEIGNLPSPTPPTFDSLAPTTTKWDIIVRDASTNIRLWVGTDTQILEADSAEPSGLKWVDKPASGWNSVFFAARSWSETNLTSGAITVVNFNTEEFDDDNVFASNTFTVPSNWKYVIYARVYTQGGAFSSWYFDFRFHKNGNNLASNYYNWVTSPWGRMSMEISFMWEFLTNDTIDVRVSNQTWSARTLRTDFGASIFYWYKLN